MTKINREDIQIITKHSNWSESSINKVLKENVYHSKASWHKFLKILFISLGVGFTTSGVIFFFAYNWTNLNKFFKIGLIEGLIISLTLIILFAKINIDIKNILLSGASILVGVLFAVFGQIYQTGANDYDFFLGWTTCITIWVLVSNYAPLWLIFISLINTTLFLYSKQVAHDWSYVFVFTILFIINILFLITILSSKKLNNHAMSPTWFSNSIALACVFFSTIGIIIGIFDNSEKSFFGLIIITLLIYGIGIKYGLKVKNGFYISIIAFSIIVIISAFLVKLSSGIGTFFLISLFVIGSVTYVIKKLINLQKKWTN